MAAIRKVCVQYRPTGHGLALTISEPDSEPMGNEPVETGGGGDAVLRVSDCGVTLELPPVDGRRPVLAWDPAEVGWEVLGCRP